MEKPKGGRGKKAPYKTEQMRVPTPIKDQVNALIAKFRDSLNNDPTNDNLKPESLDITVKEVQIDIFADLGEFSKRQVEKHYPKKK